MKVTVCVDVIKTQHYLMENGGDKTAREGTAFASLDEMV
jgi:hypothetical protein